MIVNGKSMNACRIDCTMILLVSWSLVLSLTLIYSQVSGQCSHTIPLECIYQITIIIVYGDEHIMFICQWTLTFCIRTSLLVT